MNKFKGLQVHDVFGKTHEVLSVNGSSVRVYGDSSNLYHTSKLFINGKSFTTYIKEAV